ncbi:MAG TPA: PhzF family phenazine biosynthesis protein [Bryobacteraceae bacterium]|jgi:trans-2,3-dihydro-3-hydroxyanthranilate isomerase
MIYNYEQWDVFTSTPLTGNPLAVFLDARGLSDLQMLAIARETNLSETTFIFPRDAAIEAERGIRVRIFTRSQELPFAGHPVLGTAMAIRMHLENPPEVVKLDLNGGLIPVTFEATAAGIYGEMLQPEPILAEAHRVADIAPLLGLPESDFDATYPIHNISTGRPNLVVMLNSLSAVKRAQVDWNAVQHQQRGFYLITQETERTSSRLHARKPTPNGDDPVTGSAAGCAAAYMVEYQLSKSAERVIIEQGSEVNRPGELYVSAERSGSVITKVHVGGYAVRVFEGRATL